MSGSLDPTYIPRSVLTLSLWPGRRTARPSVGHGVESARAQRVTSRQPPDPQPPAANRTVAADCFDHELGTGGDVAAASCEQRRQQDLVALDRHKQHARRNTWLVGDVRGRRAVQRGPVSRWASIRLGVAIGLVSQACRLVATHSGIQIQACGSRHRACPTVE